MAAREINAFLAAQSIIKNKGNKRVMSLVKLKHELNVNMKDSGHD